jgi:adenine-specific DNA-methyltransferase
MNADYLKKQIITYMGNKRKLLTQISEIIDMIVQELGNNLTCADAFSGSGIVSRLLKTKSKMLYVNDIAGYSETLNKLISLIILMRI